MHDGLEGRENVQIRWEYDHNRSVPQPTSGDVMRLWVLNSSYRQLSHNESVVEQTTQVINACSTAKKAALPVQRVIESDR